MNKKYLVLLAKEISMIEDPQARFKAYLAVSNVAIATNPLFDLLRFYNACGISFQRDKSV
jgi:hypothetical protein